MKPTDADIRRYAAGLAKSYGHHSLTYADDMIRAYLANGHTPQLEVWRKVRGSLPAAMGRRSAAREREAVAAE